MAEYDKDKQAKEYHLDIPVNNYGFFIEGWHEKKKKSSIMNRM